MPSGVRQLVRLTLSRQPPHLSPDELQDGDELLDDRDPLDDDKLRTPSFLHRSSDACVICPPVPIPHCCLTASTSSCRPMYEIKISQAVFQADIQAVILTN